MLNPSIPQGRLNREQKYKGANATDVFGDEPTTPPLFVAAGSASSPVYNDAFTLSHSYSYAGGTLLPASGPVIDCQVDWPEGPISPGVRHTFEEIAKDHYTYSSFTDSRKWIGQYMDWQAVSKDSALADSSVIMSSFRSVASLSRYAYLTNIEDQLMLGDVASALTLLCTTPTGIGGTALGIDTTTGVAVTDDSAADFIVGNQKLLYRIYRHYMLSSMDSADSSNVEYIAGLCPLIYGTSVYRARSLHSALYPELRVWSEDCSNQRNGQRTNNRQNEMMTEQLYSLFPNPNDGKMVLTQSVTDTAKMMVDVTDITGRVVYRGQKSFVNKSMSMDFGDLIPGLYILTLEDKQSKKTNFKFVKQ